MRKKISSLCILFIFSVFFAGCTFFETEKKPHIFIPKDNTISASVFAGNTDTKLKTELKNAPESKFIKINSTSIIRENTEFFLLAQKLSPQKKKEFRLYSNDEKPCSQSREKITNLCIFEVWEKTEEKNEQDSDMKKIFFFEETESGQFSDYYSGDPIAWKGENSVVFEHIQEKKSGIKHVFSLFNVTTQEFKNFYQIAFWKDFSTQEKNGFISLTKNGTQYFFDPESYEKSFRAYRVIDASQPFYVRSSALENLVLIDSLPEKNIQKIEWLENFSAISFQVWFLNEEGEEEKNREEETKIYEFSGKNGFVENKISG